jgi:glycosyltransferase involved in cell wall biosynthesis
MKHQILPENLHLSMSVAYVEGTGNPSCEEVIEYFKEQGLDVRGVPYPDTNEFQYRGWTRNKQLEECDADWILFADTDMVYPPDFFKTMYDLLLTDEYKDSPNCLHSARFSTTLNETEDMVESYHYPCMVDDCWNLVQYLPGQKKSNVGAGYCQIANVKLLKESKHPYYCVPGKKIDYSYDKFHKTKSDQHFRKRLGAKKIPLPIQYHLQHIRDNEVGKHIELQR